ncbi:MAG: HAD family hydrolase [Egibacteraceae bacterium]
MLGLPEGVRACLFDLDGVLTRTATVHAAAWKEMFDEFLRQRAAEWKEPFVAFDPLSDYERSVDGKPRVAGTRSFLESRGITLPEGTPSDPPGAATVHGLSNRKNELVLRRLSEGRVEVFDGSVRYARLARDAGLRSAVVSSSANTRQVLDATGIADLFDVVMDGLVAGQRGLAGKPAPDTFLAAAADLGVGPREAAVFEDALAGVQAGHAGGFALVVGVDRTGQAAALRDSGADVVVNDLAELLELA